MTVQELIDKLNEIENKSLTVVDYEGTIIDDVVKDEDGVRLE